MIYKSWRVSRDGMKSQSNMRHPRGVLNEENALFITCENNKRFRVFRPSLKSLTSPVYLRRESHGFLYTVERLREPKKNLVSKYDDGLSHSRFLCHSTPANLYSWLSHPFKTFSNPCNIAFVFSMILISLWGHATKLGRLFSKLLVTKTSYTHVFRTNNPQTVWNALRSSRFFLCSCLHY